MRRKGVGGGWVRGGEKKTVHEKQKERKGEREVNVDVWAVTVRYLRSPQRRAQAALVQVPLVCRVMLCLSVSQSHSLSRCLKSEFSYWRARLDIMNNFSLLNAGMKRKWSYLGMPGLSVRLILSAWPCVCVRV